VAGDPAQREVVRQQFVEYAATRSPDLRDQLIDSHLGLSQFLARRYRDRGEPIDDLVQVASIGLVKAVDRFDPDLGFEFSTFATRYILGELKRHFRDRTWSVRPPRRLQDLHLRLDAVVADLTQQLQRSPTIPEIAVQAGAPEEDVLEAMEAARGYRAISLDAPAGGDGSDPGSRLGQDDAELHQTEDRASLAALLSRLPERQADIVRLRFFDGLTQSEIGARLGISQVHVSRLLERSLSQMRELVRD
jgi:RNA polymerase sigma-B factor